MAEKKEIEQEQVMFIKNPDSNWCTTILTQIQFAQIKSYGQVQNQWGKQQTFWTLLGSTGK